MLLVALLLSFELLVLVMAARVIGPLAAAARLARDVGRGRFTAIIASKTRDEVGRVVAALNGTVARVCAAYGEIAVRLDALGGRAPAAAQRVRDALAALAGRFEIAAVPAPKRGHDTRLPRTRTALFTLIFAESLSYSFFPIFAKELYSAEIGLPEAVAIGLPIAAFWLLVAVTQPTVGVWARGARRRPLFIAGAALTALGLALSGLATDIHALLLWRAVTALGYGALLIVCQSDILDAAGPEARTQGAALFTSVYFSATICGTAIGGVIADQIGYGPTLVVSAAIAAMTPVFVIGLRETAGAPAPRRDRPWRTDVALLLRNPRFVALTPLAAVPARLVNAAFLFYLAPLFLDALQNSKPETARVMMIYAVVMAFTSPLWAKLVDRWRRPLPFVAAGGLLSGLGMLAVLARPDTWGVVAAIALLGTAQAFSMTSQITLVALVTPAEQQRLGGPAVLGLFRMVERAGSVAGPFLAGVFAARYGYQGSMAAIGLIVAAAALLMMLVFAATRPRGEAQGLAAPPA